MTRHTARYEKLLRGREVGNALGRGGGIGPGPGGEFVDEIVAGEDELFGRNLARCTEGGGVRDGSPAVSECVESRVD